MNIPWTGGQVVKEKYSSVTCHVTLKNDKCVLDCTTLASNVLNQLCPTYGLHADAAQGRRFLL